MALPVPRGKQIDVLAMRPHGHIVVLGTAGSGKTTVAALRARILADPDTSHGGPTLLVTFNKSLVKYLEAIAVHELSNVDVRTFHRFAMGYLSAHGKMHWAKIIKPSRQRALVKSAMEETGLDSEALALGWSENALLELLCKEFRVICGVPLSRTEYARDTTHRNESLAEAFGADAIYDVLETYRAIRDSDGERYDYDDVVTAAWETMRDDRTPRMYKHIVIDEGQDFAPAMLRTLIAAVPEDGSVTFFGDVAQQIYGRSTNWREAGFRVAKPEIFDENLRNTPEIARLGVAVASMPYYHDVPDIIVPRTPMDAGPLPTLVRYKSYTDEINAVCDQARNAVTTQNVAIVCPTKSLASAVMQRLTSLGETKHVRLDRKINRWYTTPHVYVTTYHNAKGLEFGAVLLPFMSKEYMPLDWLTDVFGDDEAQAMAGSWLYVGITRCRRNLVITYHGALSALLPDDRPPNEKLYNRLDRA